MAKIERLDMLDNISIRGKSLVLITIALLMCLLATGTSLQLLNSAFQQETRLIIKAVTDSGYGILEFHHQRYLDGHVSEAQARQDSLAQLRLMRYGQDGYLFVIEEGVIRLQPFQPSSEGLNKLSQRSPDGSLFIKDMMAATRNGGESYIEYQWALPQSDEIATKVSYVKGFPPWNWTLGTGIYDVDSRAVAIAWFKKHTFGIALMFFAFSILISMIHFMNKSSSRRANSVIANLSRFASGDFSQPVKKDGGDEFGQMKISLQSVQTHMSHTLSHLMATVGSVRRNMNEIASSNNNLAKRTEDQASNLAESTHSLTDIASNVRLNSNSAKEAHKLANSARESVRQGTEVVKEAVEAMDLITASTRRVNEIVDVIDDIAFQTNLLALNAAVEAARAGEQGKGFAVVANEVRNLAQRSASSAHEIKELIVVSNGDVKKGAELVSCSGRLLDEILDKSDQVSEHLHDIAAATEQQAAGVENTSSSLAELDDFVQKNAAMVEQVAGASQSLLNEMDGLQNVMSKFDVGNKSHDRTTAESAFEKHATPPVNKRVVAKSAMKRGGVKNQVVKERDTAISAPAPQTREQWETF